MKQNYTNSEIPELSQKKANNSKILKIMFREKISELLIKNCNNSAISE